MADSKPVTTAELASRTSTTERYVREWLTNQCAGGYISYYPNATKYTLLPEQATALENENSPVFALGDFQSAMAFFRDEPKITETFSKENVLIGEIMTLMYTKTLKDSSNQIMLHIVSSWIPSLNGGKVEEKLRRSSNGTKVADVGCGHGVSTIIMAKTYPNSKFIDLITINRLLKQHVKEQKKRLK
jgi:hypothetical protein